MSKIQCGCFEHVGDNPFCPVHGNGRTKLSSRGEPNNEAFERLIDQLIEASIEIPEHLEQAEAKS